VIRIAFVILVAIVAAIAIAVLAGSRRWHRTSLDYEARLLRAPAVTIATSFERAANLPPPVAKYLRLVLKNQSRRITVARFSEAGELRTDVTSGRWMRFAADQVVAPPALSFVWDARVRVFPLVHMRVRDAYVSGEGSGEVNLLSAVTIGRERGGDVLAAGELYRYLAEAVWYPTALLPGPQLVWTPIDDRAAQATLTHGATTVSLQFRFNDAGEVTGVYTPSRPAKVAGGYESRAWEGHFRNYEARQGLLIPIDGVVGWYVAGEWHPVWRGIISTIDYTF